MGAFLVLGRSVHRAEFVCLISPSHLHARKRADGHSICYILTLPDHVRLLDLGILEKKCSPPPPQVESLSPGHYFDSRREGSILRQPRKVAAEVMRKLPRMLPNPPHPNSAVFAVFEEDALNFSRFVISGPVDTPYENGLFVFDVFLPANYPTDPPLVQMVTTGQGTVK